MIVRLVQLKPCIQKALADLGTNQFYQENDFKVLEEMLSVLKPTELVLKELIKESSNLLTCEGVVPN
jgi:hypothetical protein